MSQFLLLALHVEERQVWLVSLWILAVGIFAGLTILLAIWMIGAVLSRIPGINRVVTPRIIREVPLTIREGVLWPVFIIALCWVGYGLVTSFWLAPYDLMASLSRVGSVGEATTEYVIAAPDLNLPEPKPQTIDVSFDGNEIRRIMLDANGRVSVFTSLEDGVLSGAEFHVEPDETYTWNRGTDSYEQNIFHVNPFVDEHYSELYVRNETAGPVKLSVTTVTDLANPEMLTIPVAAISVILFFLIYVVQRSAMPRLSAVALSTARSEIMQPLFLILIAVGTFGLAVFIWLPYNTFGEDIKVYKDSGLTLIMVFGIVLAVWASSTSVSEEIEGRTALTVLSKPISRRSFLAGKFVGIAWTVALLFVILGVILLIGVAFKPVHDAKESAASDPTWQLCHFEVIHTIPGLVLAYMETLVLAALSVAISTRLTMLANFICCFAIYVLGHLTPLIVQSSVGKFELVQFVGELIATVFPNLDHFNIQAAVAAGVRVPYEYLGMTLLYCVIYSLIAMLLALVMFEDRDLA